MALLAEEIVEEWLNRKGFFTIRGIKLGVHEIDILALKLDKDDVICRHVEVQASMRPISYISKVPKAVQNATGRAAMSAKERSIEELEIGVKEWIDKKYYMEKKKRLRQALYQGKWEFELVVHQVKHPEELQLIKSNGITVHRLSDVVLDLEKSDSIIASASGAPLVDLVLLKRSLKYSDVGE